MVDNEVKSAIESLGKTFEAFKETGNVFDKELANKLRTHVYEKGSTEEAMDLYVKFRGKKPMIEPLLRVRGLDK